MASFTIEFITNESAKPFPDNTLSSFTSFQPEQLNLEGQWAVAVSEISYASMYQTLTEGKVLFFDTKLSNSSEYYHFEPGQYHSITNKVEAIDMLIQRRHNKREISVSVKVSR